MSSSASAETGTPLDVHVRVRSLPKEGAPVVFEADEDERGALAARLGIPKVERMTADLRAQPWRGEGARVMGRLRAEVVQTCVVTLEPVPQSIDEAVDLRFLPEPGRPKRLDSLGGTELDLDPEGDDAPEHFTGDRIELGEILTELLALALDPYPRAAGVDFEAVDTDPEPDGGKVSPFAGLARLQSGDTPDD
ncbi:YceD family protein [Mangrovibrevibacter kandeliae]|uniref:YceD family protein n=1 Tax=Mangrovibrevibacter kandeliae TaxID=2968473 RepID=UPI0021197990|nr:DUF177 domain-containing protein [Aurantimonas sp. CSK15Z-1]MCQ8781434.1 DUF177 domain-containing protein [Aurantimonas sp. CSK15Z-1]